MQDINHELYNFLCENTDLITEKWLSKREEIDGSIYSKNAEKWAVKTIAEQNTLTNLTVASSLLNDCNVFQENKKNWALVVAESRVNSNTPIHEVLDALAKVRTTYWHFIEQFVEREGKRVLRSDIMSWGIAIHMAFDELMVEFSTRYHELMNKRLNAQQSLIDELNAPIIKLNSTIGVLPIIGDVDTTRVQVISDFVPHRCTELDVSHLYIDLSGVSILDTMVANHIYQLTQILDLLGIESTITGIRPEIAQTSVQLGLDFSRIRTTSSLQLALKNVFREKSL
ncbi:STAS domain-containing protein [Sporosarcina highlanderae]|uniref:STAS domain-containing protein n=1 Tax=Sporosarcina highlanderae TaxID=3035916 RepID=A0ABT8JTA6_9BACL|nr:STAS domain-containing protein [Sporosarcina highlanderae]MDN4608355.1 STAS domain-containing protein [Sporosarcina highlanderae]